MLRHALLMIVNYALCLFVGLLKLILKLLILLSNGHKQQIVLLIDLFKAFFEALLVQLL